MLTLVRILLPELCNVLLHLDHALFMKCPPVPKEECQLHEHKQRGCDECLIPGVKEGRGAALKNAMADELEDPASNMNPNGNLEHRVPKEECIRGHPSAGLVVNGTPQESCCER